jgi:hypothetical protein
MNQPKIELRLRRLIIAISNFDAVINACDMLIDGNVDQNASYYRIFTAGIVVSYMRPFLRADGLGPLPQEFQEFPDNPDLKELHEDLKHGRHWVFAHHSAEDSPSLVQPEKQQGVKDIEVHFEETGRPTG